jgi:glycosyltransferase involved in cell wall biosynthesis
MSSITPPRTSIKVLHPITRLIVGGAQENTLYTAQYLNPERYAVHVLTGPQTGSEGSLLDEASDRGIKVNILPELVREISLRKDTIALKKMIHLLRDEHYTIVHTHSSKAGILGRLAAHRSSTPIILHTVHGWSFHDHMHPILRLMYILLERLAYRYCDALIFVSKKDIDQGISTKIVTKDNFHLIRSAIPIDIFNPGLYLKSAMRRQLNIPQDVPVLGNIGRFSVQKDPLSWIRVAALVNSVLPDCRFLLVGDGPLRHQVEDEVTKLGLSQRIILTGLRRDIPELLSTMDVFLITSLWEGLPRVIPQSLAMEIPVVSNQVDGINETIIDGKTGFLAEPGDYQSLANQCLRILHEPILRQSLGAQGRALVLNEFSLDRMIAQIEKIYEDLLVKKQIREI